MNRRNAITGLLLDFRYVLTLSKVKQPIAYVK